MSQSNLGGGGGGGGGGGRARGTISPHNYGWRRRIGRLLLACESADCAEESRLEMTLGGSAEMVATTSVVGPCLSLEGTETTTTSVVEPLASVVCITEVIAPTLDRGPSWSESFESIAAAFEVIVTRRGDLFCTSAFAPPSGESATMALREADGS